MVNLVLPFLFWSWAAQFLVDHVQESRSVSRSLPARVRSDTATIIDLEAYRERRANRRGSTRLQFGSAVPRRDC
jgi:hypothetical protein